MTTTDRRDADDATFAPALSVAERARLDRIESTPVAAESYDPAVWEALSELIPCSEFAGCADECECVEGELRLAITRLVITERVHAASCEGDDCCVALEQRARLVGKAAAIAALRPAPGTDSSGQAVQRVLDLADELENEADEVLARYSSNPLMDSPIVRDMRASARTAAFTADRIRDAVAGPQRDHGGEGGQ